MIGTPGVSGYQTGGECGANSDNTTAHECGMVGYGLGCGLLVVVADHCG